MSTNNAALRVEGVNVSFGGLRALNDVYLEIGKNEVVGLIGPNGAGKTTLFNALCGLAKRELIQIGEDAILVASHSLDESRYYSSSSNSIGQQNQRVPINCELAALKFSVEVNARKLRRNFIGVTGWSCSNDQITASISSSIKALVEFPILSRINGGKIGVNATIGATSEISRS